MKIPSFRFARSASAIVLALGGLHANHAFANIVACTPDSGYTSCQSFYYTGAVQSFTVPANVTSVKVKAWGAAGGLGNLNNTIPGGGGGYTTGSVAVQPGATVFVTVGQGGGNTTSTGAKFGGGGTAANGGWGGSGGGMSALASGTSLSSSNVLLVAGGGGGAGAQSGSGAGGGASGSDGTVVGWSLELNAYGRGGTSSAGGMVGTDSGRSTTPPTVGAQFQGGNGGYGTVSWEGGGGGGGYFGGGGGGYSAGGGGGSGYCGAATGCTTTAGSGATVANGGDAQYVSDVGAGATAGNGYVFLEWGVVAAATPLIAPLQTPPGVRGLGSQPATVDLSTYSGPNMMTCLLAGLKQMFGADAVYLGQNSTGAARISQGGKIISFYPLSASTATGLGIIYASSNASSVLTSCGSFGIAPAIYNLTEFGAAMAGIGGTAQIDSTGVINATINGLVYVARPDYFVTQGGGTAGLAQGSDGKWRFTDSAGNTQILYPAFIDSTSLQNAAATALGGNVSILYDGTATFTFINGTQLTWTPEMVLSPASLVAPAFVNDAANHYKYRTAASYQGMSSR